MRALVMLVGALAAFAGSYFAFTVMQAVGPDNRAGEFGYGAGAKVSPGGGDLLEARNFARVVEALERELGKDGAVAYLTLERTGASASSRSRDGDRSVEIDASGRSQARDSEGSGPAAQLAISRLDPAVVEALVRETQKQSGAPVEEIRLQPATHEWTVSMDGGEPDEWVANLDGTGLRLPGEPNPEPIGASPDSLLRAENLTKVIAAARKEAPPGARVTDFDVRPERVMFTLAVGSRELALDYGYDAQLTRRALEARTGPDEGFVRWEDIDPQAPERMALAARRAAGVKGLGEVQYVLLNSVEERPGLSMYFRDGTKPPYVFSDLHGRGITWPGRE